MKQFLALALTFIATLSNLYAQNGVIKGRVFDPINNEPVPFANVVIQGTTTGTTTDVAGEYEIGGLEPGLYNLQVSYLGYETRLIYEIQVTNVKPAQIDVELQPATETIDEVTIKASPFSKTAESPVSLRSIGVNEIQRYPGGNRDISKVIQSLPGVASTVSFRNDILIRGGSPAENAFYLDGIEVPTINHFATQGASGGPVGLINVDFIREVDFYTGAFPANRGNTLSSVMELKLKEGRDDKLGATFTLGASEASLSLEGPIGEKTTFIVSARRSYLQFLFQLFELPFLPTYNDFQFKTKTKFNDKHELTLIGLGAIDQFALNLDANETEDQQYILGILPENEQWSYAVGARYKIFSGNSYWTFVASHNHLNNTAQKFINNDDSNPNNKVLEYSSDEIENKLRIEHTTRTEGGFRINWGVNYELTNYRNSSYIRTAGSAGTEDTISYDTDLVFNQYGAFAQLSKAVFDDRLDLSLGFRIDGTDYSKEMSNPFSQFSPRFSASYALDDQWSLNFNTGLYYQLPPYTTMGFGDFTGTLVNKENGLKYIHNVHVVAGVEYNTNVNSKFSVEGFFKRYYNYPFLLNDSISLANLGGDFGVIGDAPVSSTSEGRAYGGEFLYQQKLNKGFYGIVSYTIYWSKFTDKTNDYVPSAWDSRHIISLTGGKQFEKNWEIGAVWKISGGSPYTPWDLQTSSLKPIWDVTQQGVLDYDQLNTERLPWFHQLDVRVSKQWFFKKWDLEVYLDIQNLYNFEATFAPYITVERDESGMPITDPDDPSRYLLKEIPNSSGQALPSVGVVVGI